MGRYFNLDTGLFEQAPPMKTKRTGHTATVVAEAGVVVVIGGVEKFTNVLATCEVFDIKEGVWAAGKVPNMKYKRGDHSATLVDGCRIVVAGGRERMVFLKATEVYDLRKNEWSAGGDLPFPRAQHGHSMFYL